MEQNFLNYSIEILESQLRDAKRHLEYNEWMYDNGYQFYDSFDRSRKCWSEKISALENALATKLESA